MEYLIRNVIFSSFYFAIWWFGLRPVFSENHADFAQDLTVRLAISGVAFVFAKELFDRIIAFLLGKDTILIFNPVVAFIFYLFVYCFSIFLMPFVLIMWGYQYWQYKHGVATAPAQK